MSTTIQEYYENAQLAQASYAVLSQGMEAPEIKNELKDEQGVEPDEYSDTQASLFASHYSIEHSQQNTDNGFSATLFKDQSDVYTFN